MSSAIDILNEPFVFVTGFVITTAAFIGVLWKGVTWLRDQVKEENKRIRQEVNQQNQEIKKEAIERIEQNRDDIKLGHESIKKDLNSNTQLLTLKLDGISKAAIENKQQIENYAKDIGKTVERNNNKVNDHETRISVIETKIQTYHNEPPKTNE